MFRNDLTTLEAAAAANDTAALDDFLFPRPRRLNVSQAFHAPLMVSAHRVKHLAKIPQLRTDAVILNLEDGVSPEQKPVALRLCALALSRLGESDKKLIVRVNPTRVGRKRSVSSAASCPMRSVSRKSVRPRTLKGC